MSYVPDNRPNFFVIGAAKSATTTICAHLQRHPDIFFSTPKEPGFFCENLNWNKGFEWYESLFKDAKGEKIIAEGSTYYTQRPVFDSTVDKISEYSPDARFLYVVRNPFDRIISHYWFDVKKHKETKTFIDAMESEPRYLTTGDYRYQLEPYVEKFGLDKILVISFEQYFNDPNVGLRDITDWLGLDTLNGNIDKDERLNEGAQNMDRVRGAGRLYGISKSPLWRAISPAIPQSLKSWVRNMAVESVARTELDIGAARAHLYPTLKQQVADFEKLLGRKFSEWGDLSSAA